MENGGQVVSLEGSLQLLEYARDFVLLPCACRRLLGHRTDLVCLNFGPIKELQGSAMPEGPMEEITLEEAKEVIHQACEEPRCMSLCGFGALAYDREAGRIRVNFSRCFGCGLCLGHPLARFSPQAGREGS